MSGVTAEPNDVRSGKIYVDSTETHKTGSLSVKTVNKVLDADETSYEIDAGLYSSGNSVSIVLQHKSVSPSDDESVIVTPDSGKFLEYVSVSGKEVSRGVSGTVLSDSGGVYITLGDNIPVSSINDLFVWYAEFDTYGDNGTGAYQSWDNTIVMEELHRNGGVLVPSCISLIKSGIPEIFNSNDHQVIPISGEYVTESGNKLYLNSVKTNFGTTAYDTYIFPDTYSFLA